MKKIFLKKPLIVSEWLHSTRRHGHLKISENLWRLGLVFFSTMEVVERNRHRRKPVPVTGTMKNHCTKYLSLGTESDLNSFLVP
jgi:hypothetical protein